jgi:putrescine transport system substrate-binding protein
MVRVHNRSDYIELLQKFEDEPELTSSMMYLIPTKCLKPKCFLADQAMMSLCRRHIYAAQIIAGAFQELDQSKLPNAANLWDFKIKATHRAVYPKCLFDHYTSTTGLGVMLAK